MASSIFRALYRGATGAAMAAALSFRRRDGYIAVSYGGARGGDRGGPLVKVRLLAERFPEHRVGFSLLYLLSNAIYLPVPVLNAVARVGVPIVLNQNGVYYRAWFPSGWEAQNARMAHAHGIATHVFYQSEFCRRCAEIFLGKRSGPGEVLYNAVDIQQFSPASLPRSGPFSLLVTGNIGPATAYRLMSSIDGLAAARKGGLDVCLRVAASLDVNVEVAARALAERRGVANSITWLGAYTSAQAPEIYRNADAYLITKHNDPCPNVVLEALASGLPVIYSRSGGVPELVGGDAGIGLPVPETFDESPPPAPDDIAAAIGRVMADRESMARAARARAVERFDLSTWLDRHRMLFEQLVAQQAS